jgi:hypothetical protein
LRQHTPTLRLVVLALCAVAAIGAAAVPPARAQSSPRADAGAPASPRDVTAVRITEAIHVDGYLFDAAWTLASPATGFLQQQPDEGQPATYRTEVRFVYDDATLYVGAMLFDDDPQRVVVNELKRDFLEVNNDLFGVVLDTFQDRRNAYGFVTNPGGAQRETLAYDQGERNDESWNTVWLARTAMLGNGWSVEMAIPFKALRFPEALEQRWGLNLVRVVRRANEVETWAPVPRQFTHYHVGYAGVLRGISGVRGGRHVRVTPFSTARSTRDGVGASWQSDADGGADLKWAITPSLVLDATYRTDFAQVEADQVQINLTRFSLLFPEKRQFFLESPGSFQIGLTAEEGGISGNMLLPFFTRRIGLSDDNTEIPVVGGLRLTGQSGGTTIGLLNMQTERAGTRRGDNFTAVRLARPMRRGLTVGGFYFGREAVGGLSDYGSHNRVMGTDLRFSPRRTLDVEALAMRSVSDGPEDDWAVRAGLRLRANQHRARMSYLFVGDRFRHDLGYVRRRGSAMMFGDYSTLFRPRATYDWVREYELKMEVHVATGTDHRELLTRQLRPSYVMHFADGSQFRATVEHFYERLDEPFRLRRTISIPPGDYTFGEGVLYYETTRSKPVSVLLHGNYGTFWGGDRRRGRVGVRWRLNAHLAASAEYDRNEITLPEGAFREGLAAIRLDWSVTTRMFLNAFVQYNGRDDVWLTNVRFNFIHRPLSDIYVVWNDAQGSAIRNRALIVKYTHSVAF